MRIAQECTARSADVAGCLHRCDAAPPQRFASARGRASHVARAGTRQRAVALRGRQDCDTELLIEHRGRDTVSDSLWRGVADGRARGVFHGSITVHPGADGADARLSNKNLLLSDGGEIDTRPALEIHADEVKAAHGATV